MLTLVYITAGSEEEAKKIGKLVVQEKLAACVNYFPIKSIYKWEGKLEDADEYVMLVKTTDKMYEKLKKRVEKEHSYETVCIMSIPVSDCTKDYLDWVESCVSH